MELLEAHGWIAWIIIGGLAGAIAKLLMPGKDPGGCIVTVLLGIAGALLAGFIGQAMELDSAMNGAGFLGAIVGAFVILLLYRLISQAAARRQAVQPVAIGPHAPCARAFGF